MLTLFGCFLVVVVGLTAYRKQQQLVHTIPVLDVLGEVGQTHFDPPATTFDFTAAKNPVDTTHDKALTPIPTAANAS